MNVNISKEIATKIWIPLVGNLNCNIYFLYLTVNKIMINKKIMIIVKWMDITNNYEGELLGNDIYFEIYFPS